MDLQKIIFQNVQEIINENDPVGLVDGGAPDDEYHTEIGKIVSILREESEREKLAQKVAETFKISFGENTEVNNDQCSLIADKLLEVKNRLKW